jgi:hypothetical protein
VDVLLTEREITHIVAAAPSELLPEGVKQRALQLHRVRMANQKESLLVALPGCVRFIQDAIEGSGRVLVHSSVASRAVVIICAYCKPPCSVSRFVETLMAYVVMSSRTMSITKAVDLVCESELHLYLVKNDLTSLTKTNC